MEQFSTAGEFIQHESLKNLLSEAEELKKNPKWQVSDILDGAGNQYVDLVQEGGGVLGIALVGYTWMLERLGIRFFHVAGTSAGAINTLLMAGLGPIDQAKSEMLLTILAQKNLFDLVDGDPTLKKITQKLIDGTPFKKLILKLLFNIRKIKQALFFDFGLNPGKDFEKWIDQILKEGSSEIGTLEQLISLRSSKHFPDKLINRITGKQIGDSMAKIAIITADITTRTKVVFPDMAHLYFKDHINMKPCQLVRASMSVPLFFMPFAADDIPDAGTSGHPEWIRWALYTGKVPPSASFVDGGLISNFPIDVFHLPGSGIPRKPTFGVRLSTFRESFELVDDLSSYLGGLIATMRHDSDNEFLRKNPDFNRLITFINADQLVNWLNFNLSDEEKLLLFRKGAESAFSFVKNFDWAEYKELRSKMSE
ncbi:MAG: patatin-like phospholipase family protein [Cyclobacteriaceae bacterium]|nr:patatin-like phospholipase family protein [Cyclobacteriaceae bacterium]